MHETRRNSLITDRNDPLIKRFQSLQTRAGRAKSGCYLVEGIRQVARAIEARASIEHVFIAPSVLTNRLGQKLARHLRQVGAVIRQDWLRLSDAPISRYACWLAVEGVQSPVGSVVQCFG